MNQWAVTILRLCSIALALVVIVVSLWLTALIVADIGRALSELWA